MGFEYRKFIFFFLSNFRHLNPVTDVLEFVLGVDKRFLKLSECGLSLQLELPENYWLDNDCVSKLFESIEINISHENVTHKSSAYDYSVSNCFFTKTSFDDSFVTSTMDTCGIWDPL